METENPMREVVLAQMVRRFDWHEEARLRLAELKARLEEERLVDESSRRLADGLKAVRSAAGKEAAYERHYRATGHYICLPKCEKWGR